ncbi:MAG: hypothetical protein M3209_00180 [Acidobacteriota bacterium]|nr:hypothetical protein [Acidobacteriota bacterium]
MSETNENEKLTKTIELFGGYTDRKGVLHKTVTFSRRPTMLDLFNIDSNPQSQIPTQYHDLLIRTMISKFGDLTMPVLVNVLLALDQYDREDLNEAADAFLRETRDDRTAEFIDDETVKLAFGVTIDGAHYDIVKFGNVLTGKDAAEADDYGAGVRRACFEIGREIVELRSSEVDLTRAGGLAIDQFNTMDAEDYAVLQTAAVRWRASFRLKRKALQRERDGVGRVPVVAGAENAGSGNSANAG